MGNDAFFEEQIFEGEMTLSPKDWDEVKARFKHFMRVAKIHKMFNNQKKLQKSITIWK